MNPRDLPEPLNTLTADKLSLIVKGLFLFALLAAIIFATAAPAMTSGETIFYDSVAKFVKQPDIEADSIDPFKLKTYIFSLPFKLGRGLGQEQPVLLMRLFGVVFLMIALFLAWQSAKRLFKDEPLLPALVLALLATNSKLLYAATAIGGDAFAFAFYAFFIYELIEITAKGSFADILISLAIVFLIAKIDFLMAERMALPILFAVIAVTMVVSFKEQLLKVWSSSPYAPPGLVLGAAGLFLMGQRVHLLSLLLFTPTAVLIGLTKLTAWPGVVRQLVAYFGAGSFLGDGFGWAQTVLLLAFQLLAATATIGIAALIYEAIAQRVRVTQGGLTGPGGETAPGGRQILFIKPQRQVFSGISIPALISVALMPVTVFAANNTYALSTILNEQHMILLALPLFLLLAVGLRWSLTTASTAKATTGLVTALLTCNLAVLLLGLMWR